MCGRFTLATPPEILAALFAVDSADWNDPRFNIAPQVRIVTVRRVGGRRTAQSLLWGAPNPKDSRPLINARSETVATSPLFARAFEGSRVLVPADGFFEWTKDGSRRQGRYFQQPGGKPFAFAGIAVSKPNSDGEPEADGAVILTTAPSDSVRRFHDRMPLIVPPDGFDLWLDAKAPLKTVNATMAQGAKTEWRSHNVGPSVNNVRNDSRENIREAEPAPDRQQSLF
jgi:putative SOS response-associated peptidase YedK